MNKSTYLLQAWARRSDTRPDKKWRLFFRKTALVSIVIFFFLLPFHGFLMIFIRFRLGVTSEFIQAWREIALVILTLLAIPLWKPRQWFMAQSRLKILIFLFFTLGLIFLIFQKENISQWMIGARYDFEFFYFFLLVSVFGFEKKEQQTILKSTIAAAVIVIVFGLVLQFLPQNFLTQFGYAPYQDEWIKGNALFSCHYVEFRNDFCRLQSTFGGPGRYASYLIFIVALAGTYAFSVSRKIWKWFWAWLFTMGMISLALTLSRSFWIAAAVMIGIAIFQTFGNLKFSEKIRFFEKRKWTKKQKIWILILSLPLFFSIVGFILSPAMSENIFTLFNRSASTSQHMKALKNGVRAVSEHPFGLGLGKAGPGSASFEKFLTENAYLQIMVEMGIIGGIIFFLILAEMLRLLYLRSITASCPEITPTRPTITNIHPEITALCSETTPTRGTIIDTRSEITSTYSTTAHSPAINTIKPIKGNPDKYAYYCKLQNSATNASDFLTVSSSDTASSVIQRFRSNFAIFVTKSYLSGFPKQILAYSCFLTLIGLMVGGLFVHSFEETSLTLTLFGYCGFALTSGKN
ncbi:O-antigen ligase family protein [Candidatus Peregrinibacteria bacterium]|nr:O-antigen ligase family protein [Candidatus Peregrinibacteria bacterium]